MPALTDEQLDWMEEHCPSKTIEMPLAKVRNLHSQIEELKKERRKLKTENTRLQKENRGLKMEVDRLRVEQTTRHLHVQGNGVVSTPDVKAAVSRQLKMLIARFHPDKHQGNLLAHEMTVALNKVREEIGR